MGDESLLDSQESPYIEVTGMVIEQRPIGEYDRRVVLLTRARQGMILFVPKGVDPEVDETRNSEYYDNIYSYLLKCGIEELE